MKKYLGILILLSSCGDKIADNNIPTTSKLNQTDSIIVQKDTIPKFSFRDTVVTIYFNKKSLNIASADIIRLKRLADICASDSLGYLKIVGFTDTIGTEESNYMLSEKRVDAVFKILDSKNKINDDVVYLTWLGESDEVYDLHFEPTHPKKNCVDIWMQIKNANR
ncbi:MAG: OmpA family protein [Bacteroidota bacterium]|nr:OmpA family protein [Bacteroidota bacterium]MDP3147438.1 OmpA family protein [Bacteroidota bacterium]